ncbi:hypothetical protein FKM82_023752 [Ascaphus truei]
MSISWLSLRPFRRASIYDFLLAFWGPDLSIPGLIATLKSPATIKSPLATDLSVSKNPLMNEGSCSHGAYIVASVIGWACIVPTKTRYLPSLSLLTTSSINGTLL